VFVKFHLAGNAFGLTSVTRLEANEPLLTSSAAKTIKFYWYFSENYSFVIRKYCTSPMKKSLIWRL